MSHRAKTSVYYLSQILIIVAAIATGSPARADDSLQQRTTALLQSPLTIAGVTETID
jgi:hypothetical protein